MPTGARKRRNIDMGRLREAMRGPGADTRVWVATARVDNDEAARTWDPKIGWIVDVTFYGGPLDQEGPIPCRLGTTFAQNGGTKSDPPGLGCEVLVAISDGDPNSNPVIVGRVHNEGGCAAPSTVNGNDISQGFAESNHITVSPFGNQEQYAGAYEVRSGANASVEADLEASIQGVLAAKLAATAGAARVEGVGITLASSGALAMVTTTPPGGGSSGTINIGGTEGSPPTEPAVLGARLQTAQSQLTTALNNYAAALLVAPVAGAVSVASATTAASALTAALAAYSAAVTAALSAKVRME